MVRFGRFWNSGATSSAAIASSNMARTSSASAPSGGWNSWRLATCIGCSRDSAMRNSELVGDIGSNMGDPATVAGDLREASGPAAVPGAPVPDLSPLLPRPRGLWFIGGEPDGKEGTSMIDFDDLRDKAEDFVEEHATQIDSGIDKAAEFAGKKYGHGEQIDKGAAKLKEFLPGDEPDERDAGRPGRAGGPPRQAQGRQAGKRPHGGGNAQRGAGKGRQGGGQARSRRGRLTPPSCGVRSGTRRRHQPACSGRPSA